MSTPFEIKPYCGWAVYYPVKWDVAELHPDNNTLRHSRRAALLVGVSIWCEAHGPVGLPDHTAECPDPSKCWRRLYRKGFRLRRIQVICAYDAVHLCDECSSLVGQEGDDA